MRRTILLAAAALALLAPATAQAAPPQCRSFTASATLIVTPGSTGRIDAPCDGAPYTLTPSAAAHGTASATGTTLTYTPTAPYHGTDVFTYTATNSDGTSAIAVVDVLVDTAPVCNDTKATIVAGTTLTFSINPCSDADGDDFEIWIQQRTPHGSVTFRDDADPIYTPDAGFVGVDTLGYFAVDSFGLDSDDATLTITVTAAPQATPTPTPAPDVSPPRVKLAAGGQRLKQVLAKGLRLSLGSSEAGRATITATLDAPTAKKLHLPRQAGQVTATATAGQVSVTLKLSAKARKALKKLKRLKLTLAAVVTDAAGNPGRTTLNVTIKR